MRSTRGSMPFGWSCACGSMPSTSGGCAEIAARSSSRDSTLTARMLGVRAGATLSRVLATRTFLFSDLRDYTRFVEQHGDIAAASLIAEYRRIVRAEVVRQLLPRSLSLPMEERAGLTLKGLDAPPRIYAVDWRAARPATARSAGPIDAAFAAAMPSSQQVLSPIVIGRDRELASLED